MEDMKPVRLSGTKRGHTQKKKNELETNSKNKISETYIEA
jgi:hypothetical protein